MTAKGGDGYENFFDRKLSLFAFLGPIHDNAANYDEQALVAQIGMSVAYAYVLQDVMLSEAEDLKNPEYAESLYRQGQQAMQALVAPTETLPLANEVDFVSRIITTQMKKMLYGN